MCAQYPAQPTSLESITSQDEHKPSRANSNPARVYAANALSVFALPGNSLALSLNVYTICICLYTLSFVALSIIMLLVDLSINLYTVAILNCLGFNV